MMRAFVSAAIRVPAALGMAPAATLSGQITTNPAMVIIPARPPWGRTLISWTTTDDAGAQVSGAIPRRPGDTLRRGVLDSRRSGAVDRSHHVGLSVFAAIAPHPALEIGHEPLPLRRAPGTNGRNFIRLRA
jgi:hypothetical protein